MIKIKIILTICLCFGKLLGFAQLGVDTLCILESDTMHFAVNPAIGSTYSWKMNGGNIVSGIGTNDITVSIGGFSGVLNLSVEETDTNGCVGEPVYTQYFINSANRAFIDGPAESCLHEEIWLRAFAGDSFAWNNGSVAEWVNFELNNDTMVYLVAFNQSCPNDTFYHSINVTHYPDASMNEIEDTLNINTEIYLEYTGRNKASFVEWHINEAYSGDGNNHFYQFTKPGDHEIKQITYAGDCTDTVTTHTFVSDNFSVHVPNSFSPNGDGLNDVFEFFGTGIQEYTALITNRWGEEIHQWKNGDIHPFWDGTINGEITSTGVYIYRIVVIDFHNTQHIYHGKITIIR